MPTTTFPFAEGRNFAFLGGEDWDPSPGLCPRGSSTPSRSCSSPRTTSPGTTANSSSTSSLRTNGVAGWARWTAEETLHAIALREYFMVTRNIDPNADEEVRVAHVMRATGRAATPRSRPWCSWRSTSVRTPSSLRKCRGQGSTSRCSGNLSVASSMTKSGTRFFDNLVAHCLEQHRTPRSQPSPGVRRRSPSSAATSWSTGTTNCVPSPRPASSTRPRPTRWCLDGIVAWGLGDEPQLKKFVSA